MRIWKTCTLVAFCIGLCFGTGMAQDDGDWINRLKAEKDWVPWTKAVRNPDQVKKLYIKNKAPLDLEALYTFRNLTGLIIADCRIDDLLWLKDFPNLTVFECQGNQLHSLEGIQALTQAEEISVKSNFIADLTPLKDLTGLTMLNLYENEITTLDSIAHLKQITHLDLGKNKIASIDPIRDWTRLHYFSVFSCYDLKSIDGLEAFTQLSSLNLSFLDIPGMSYSILDSMENLEYLCVQGALSSDADLAYIGQHTGLKSLTMGKNDAISELSYLADLTALEYLDIHSNNVTDIRVVGFMPKLIKLVMYRNQITDISPLEPCTELRSLFMFENPIESYRPLGQMTRLQHLHLSKSDFNAERAAALKKRLTATKIVYM